MGREPNWECRSGGHRLGQGDQLKERTWIYRRVYNEVEELKT